MLLLFGVNTAAFCPFGYSYTRHRHDPSHGDVCTAITSTATATTPSVKKSNTPASPLDTAGQSLKHDESDHLLPLDHPLHPDAIEALAVASLRALGRQSGGDQHNLFESDADELRSARAEARRSARRQQRVAQRIESYSAFSSSSSSSSSSASKFSSSSLSPSSSSAFMNSNRGKTSASSGGAGVGVDEGANNHQNEMTHQHQQHQHRGEAWRGYLCPRHCSFVPLGHAPYCAETTITRQKSTSSRTSSSSRTNSSSSSSSVSSSGDDSGGKRHAIEDSGGDSDKAKHAVFLFPCRAMERLRVSRSASSSSSSLVST